MNNNNAGILNPFNLAALMMVGGFLALAAFTPAARPDNRKRDALLAELQHGLRDENVAPCANAISKLSAEFGNQILVQSCVMLALVESLEVFGPEIAYKMIQDIKAVAPGSKIHLATVEMGQTLPAYSECVSQVRSETFAVMSKILGKAEIPLSVMDRRDVLDFKVTHKDRRPFITPMEFYARYRESVPASKHKPHALG